MARTMHADGFSAEEIKSGLHILGFNGFDADAFFQEWQAEMDNAPRLPRCIAKGHHDHSDTCKTCERQGES